VAEQRVSLVVHKGTWTARENYGGERGTGSTPVEAAMDLANKLADHTAWLQARVEQLERQHLPRALDV
jgi:hypothetical protein